MKTKRGRRLPETIDVEINECTGEVLYFNSMSNDYVSDCRWDANDLRAIADDMDRRAKRAKKK